MQREGKRGKCMLYLLKNKNRKVMFIPSMKCQKQKRTAYKAYLTARTYDDVLKREE